MYISLTRYRVCYSRCLNSVSLLNQMCGGRMHIHLTLFQIIKEFVTFGCLNMVNVYIGLCVGGGGGYFVYISSSHSTFLNLILVSPNGTEGGILYTLAPVILHFFNLIIVSPNGTSTRINSVHKCGVGMAFCISSQTAKFMGPTWDEHCYQGLQCGSAQPTGWTLTKIIRNQNVYLCHSEFSASLL